jgi:hypothetical protein
MTSQVSPFFLFAKRLLLYTVILVIVCYAIRYFLPAGWRTPALPYLFPFFFSVNIVVHYVLLKATEKRFSKFVNYYLAGTFSKLILYVAVLLLYILLHRPDALPFTVTFFFLYILYTSFEVIALLSNKVQPPAKE